MLHRSILRPPPYTVLRQSPYAVKQKACKVLSHDDCGVTKPVHVQLVEQTYDLDAGLCSAKYCLCVAKC